MRTIENEYFFIIWNLFEKFCKTNNANGTTINPEKDTERVIAFNSVKIKLLLPNPAWNNRRKNNENDITIMTFAIRSLNDEFDNWILLKNSTGKNRINIAEKNIIRVQNRDCPDQFVNWFVPFIVENSK